MLQFKKPGWVVEGFEGASELGGYNRRQHALSLRRMRRGAMPQEKSKRTTDYWRVVILYSDGETSANRIFKDQNKAASWARRQEKSKVVKRCRIEPFTREINEWWKRF